MFGSQFGLCLSNLHQHHDADASVLLHFTIGADDEPRITAMRQQKLEKRKSDKYSMKTLRRREDFQSSSKKEEYYN